MNVGTEVLDALAPTFGATVRFRRYALEETADGGTNPTPERIAGVEEDLKVVLYAIDERKSRQLFGSEVQATAVAVITTELAALVLTGDRMVARSGVFVGRAFDLIGRSIADAGELGGVVTLALRALVVPPTWRWD